MSPVSTVPNATPSWASSIVRSATWIAGPSEKLVSGLTTRSDSAAATVNALKVEPGS
jgi:hypothetical protein